MAESHPPELARPLGARDATARETARADLAQTHSRLESHLAVTRRPCGASTSRSVIPLCLLFVCRPLVAQSTGGNLEGRVITAGAALAGASVTVSCANLPGTRSRTTDSRGSFSLDALPAGLCDIVIGAYGFRFTRFTSVRIELGRTASLGSISLQPSPIALDEVVVRAPPVGIDPASPALVSTIHSDELQQLPADREFRSALSIVPQVEPSYLPGDGANISGGTGPETVYNVDGANITEVSVASGGLYLPVNFIEEVQVTSGGFDTDVGGGTGGAVSVVTRSGGSGLRGGLLAYYTGDQLSAAPRFPVGATSERGFSSFDLGGTLSGPIVRDRLSFFVGLDPTRQRRRIALPGVPVAVESRTLNAFAAKLIWRGSDRWEGTLTLLGDPGSRQSVSLVSPFLSADSIRDLHAVMARGPVGGTLLAGRTRLRVGSAALINIGLSHEQRADDAAPPTGGSTDPLFYDVPANALSGGLGIASRLRTDRLSGNIGLTVPAGSHALKIGGGLEWDLYDYRLSYGLGSGGPQGFVLRLDSAAYLWVRGYDAGRVANRVTTAFVQDAWRIGQRLTLSGGVRWSHQDLVDSAGRLMQRFGAQWQPRAGIVYLLGRPGSQRVFASVGRIYETFPANLARFYLQSRRQLITSYDHDPRADSTRADTVFASLAPMSLAAPGLEGQSFDDFLVGYDRLIGERWLVGVRVHHRRLRWVVEDGFDTTAGVNQVGNPGRGALSFLPRARHEYTAVIISISGSVGHRLQLGGAYVLSRAYGNYEGLYDYPDLQSFPNTSLQFDLPEQVRNSTGLLPNDRTHVVKGHAAFDAGAGLVVGLIGSVGSGTPRNELGASTIGAPEYIFLRPRGSAGRTPAVIDLDVRAAWTIRRRGDRAVRLTLDLYQIGNRRTVIRFDDAKYLGQDGNGSQTVVNPNYGRGVAFQPPFSARIGVMADF